MNWDKDYNKQCDELHSRDYYCNPDTSASGKKEALVSITTRISNGEVDLNTSIKSLADYLTVTDERIRAAAYEIMDVTLNNIKNKQEVVVQTLCSLLRFFGDRLHDYECVNEILTCIKTLMSTWKNSFENDLVSSILHQLLNDVSIPALTQPLRLSCYVIFDLIATHYPSMCKLLFANGFIQSIDGERDPKNLLYIFQLIPKLCSVCSDSIPSVAEELFEALSCYFPITYTPAADDPRNITSQDLSLALTTAMTSHPSFSTYCFPFLMEKLSTVVLETKKESIKALTQCIQTFGEDHTRPFLTEIWAYIRTEIIRTSNMDYVHLILDSITLIVNAVCSTNDPNINFKNIHVGLIRPAVTELESTTHSKFGALYSRMIYSAAVASPSICKMICDHMIPHILQINDHHQHSHHHHHHDGQPCNHDQSHSPSSSTMIMITQLAQASIETSSSFSHFDSIVEKMNQSSNESEAIELISRLSILNPDSKSCLDWLNRSIRNDQKRETTLNALQWMSKHSESLVIRFIDEHFDLDTIDESDLIVNVAILSRMGVQCGSNICRVIVMKLMPISNRSKFVMDGIHVMVSHCESMSVDRTMMNSMLDQIMSNANHRVAFQIVLILHSKCDLELQNECIKRCTSSYERHPHLLCALLISCRQQISFCDLQIGEHLITSSIRHGDSKSLYAIASVLNKLYHREQYYHQLLQCVAKHFVVSVDQYASAHHVDALSVVLRYLYMRGEYSVGDQLGRVLIGLLDHQHAQIKRAASNGFAIVMNQSKYDHHVIRQVLYKQRFFTVHANQLNHHRSNSCHLVAFANMIYQVNQSVISSEMSKLFPMVLRSLSVVEGDDVSVVDLVGAGLRAVKVLLSGDDTRNLIVDYLGSLIPHLLRWCRYESDANVRLTSVICLNQLVTFQYYKLHPFRQSVLDVLGEVIGDKKRLVRREAVKCRNDWFVLSE
ncbi:MMS19 [Acrasis kona]|uniref:MMS19 nucleotide excision repair protein n=1 Tax=Acrasis kona TaxID=1008807 RepID=A0AAW2ZHK3_9EUKA